MADACAFLPHVESQGWWSSGRACRWREIIILCNVVGETPFGQKGTHVVVEAVGVPRVLHQGSRVKLNGGAGWAFPAPRGRWRHIDGGGRTSETVDVGAMAFGSSSSGRKRRPPRERRVKAGNRGWWTGSGVIDVEGEDVPWRRGHEMYSITQEDGYSRK